MAKSNDKDHWRRVLFQITKGVRSLIFYWGSADHIQRDAEVRWCDMTWVVARPLTFDSLANLVTLAAFCWCRTPSPWWRVHFFFFFKYQQYFFNHPFMRMIIESHLSKLVRTPAPATPLTMFTPAPLGKRKYCQLTSFFKPASLSLKCCCKRGWLQSSAGHLRYDHQLPPKWNQPEKRPVALPRYNFTETGQGTRVAYL